MVLILRIWRQKPCGGETKIGRVRGCCFPGVVVGVRRWTVDRLSKLGRI